jgi:hypothetical protein
LNGDEDDDSSNNDDDDADDINTSSPPQKVAETVTVTKNRNGHGQMIVGVLVDKPKE